MQLEEKKKFDPRWPLIIITLIGLGIFGVHQLITTDGTTEEDRILDKEIREFVLHNYSKCKGEIWVEDWCRRGHNNNLCTRRSLNSSEYRKFRLWKCRRKMQQGVNNAARNQEETILVPQETFIFSCI